MSRQSQRALVASMMMILASLAGCIGTDDLEETDALGTVMVSTYHVEQIVSAVGGDLVNVEMMSMSNIPVHDYEPSAQDLIRLQSSDVFFYHGLGLEPWVDETLDTMGADAPLSSATHAMPAGMETLDFETLLIDELCGYLNGASTTDVHQLAEHAEDGEELHGDAGAYNLVMPEHEDEHDHEEGEHDDDHDEHDHEEGEHDDDHDEHDHEGDGHVEPEETLSTTDSACPAGTTVSVYHFEEGEYVFEFEAEDMETFTMAMAAMAGAHDHAHDHGDHDDHDDHDEHEEGDHDDHDDDHDEHEGVCHDTTTHENHDEYETEEACEAAGHLWMEDGEDHGEHDHDEGEHDDEMTAEEALSAFDSNNDSNLSWDEFWVAWNTDDDHDEHDHEEGEHDENETSDDDEHDHEEEHSPLEEALEEYMMEMLMTMFNESDADNSGGLSLEELEHFIEDIDAMEDEDIGMPGGDFIVGAFDEDSDNMLSFEEFSEMMGMEHDHDDNGTHDENESEEEEFMEAMMEMMFNMSDANGDGYLNASEVEMMFEMMDDEDDHEEGLGFIHVHIEREGDYGIALPAGVELHVLSEGGHEGHDHDEHAHDEGDEHHDEEEGEHHDEEGGEHHDEEEGEHHDEEEGEHHDEDDHDDHGEDEALAYDPHSWLSPMAYAAQVDVVVGVMSTAFPDGAETFRANGDAFKAELNTLDDGFKAAFGESGTCTSNSVAANHNAYAYIADAYDIEFVTVHGLDPEGEPSAADIAEVVERIGEDEITVLFVEEYTDASAVDSLVQQTVSDDLPNGVTVLTLYTMEMAPMDASDDYLSLMNKNLENLKTGLGC